MRRNVGELQQYTLSFMRHALHYYAKDTYW